MGLVGRAATAAIAGVCAKLAYRAIDQRDQATGGRLIRSNHRGDPVTLALGPAVVTGATTGFVLAPGLAPRVRAAGALAALVGGGFGLYDDLVGSTATKGFRGHLTALTEGEVTSGAIKILGIGATGAVTGPLARAGRGGVIDGSLAAFLVAGSANLINLFDLRPGRAIKAFLIVAAPGLAMSSTSSAILAAPLGSSLGVLNDDLAARGMLGDSGANALGALLGIAGASVLSRRGLVVAVGLVTGLTLLSERVSFSTVIADQPALAWLDDLGRRPAS